MYVPGDTSLESELQSNRINVRLMLRNHAKKIREDYAKKKKIKFLFSFATPLRENLATELHRRTQKKKSLLFFYSVKICGWC